MASEYERPRLVVLGSFANLTQESGNDGEDPCRFNEPRDTNKQTGPADYILGQANLTTCSA
jgi:hypothetical protein